MQQTQGTPDWRPVRWAGVATALAAAMTLLAHPAMAGPKGTIVVRPLGTATITLDGSIADWPLDKFTAVSQQPLAPMAQEHDLDHGYGRSHRL